MAELKTQKTRASVSAFLNAIADDQRRADCKAVSKLMQEITGEKPAMWGSAIVGFGTYTYRYATGRTGDWPVAAFSPRKQNLTLYIMAGFDGYPELMAKLGPHSTGKSCLYVKRLSDLHLPTLKKLISQSVRHVRKQYPCRGAN
ncbi:MAG: DUF1801 domain-containing protein [Acidimicrobiia bacterium]|nr:DUF1801 domain-containing protein [Acidimicrobiia bacterium]